MVLINAPPAAPINGIACAATFSDTIIPKRDANMAMNLTSTGAPSCAKPFFVIN